MDTITLPETVIIDIKDIGFELMNLLSPGIFELEDTEFMFLEETLSVLSDVFTEYKKFETHLADVLVNFMDGTIVYRKDTNITNKELAVAVQYLARDILFKLISNGCYIRGWFPYKFKELTHDMVIVFMIDYNLTSDRYLDLNDEYTQHNHTRSRR